MGLRKQSFETATAGALSTSNPPTSGTDTAFDIVTVDGTATASIISSAQLYGSKCLECTQSGTASSNAYGRWNTSGTTIGSIRFAFVCVGAVPASGNQVLWRGVDNAGGRWATLQITPASKLQLVISGSDTIVYTSASALSADTRYGVQIQWSAFSAGGTTNLNFDWYTDDFGTPVDAGYTSSSAATGTGTAVAHVRFGRTTGTTTNTIRFDAIAYDDTTSTPIGPVGGGTGPNYAATITESIGIDDTTNPQGIDRSATVGESLGVTDSAATNAYTTIVGGLVGIDDDVTATSSTAAPLSASTITAIVDDVFGPRVQMVISPIPASAATITVWRNFNGQRSIVRGASRAPVSGDTAVVDYWAPVGVPVFYTSQTFDVAGNPSQLSTPSASVVLDTPDAWLSDPFDPASAMPVALTSHSGRTAEARFASFRTATYALPNASVAPVYGSGEPIGYADVRQAASGVPIEIRTFDTDTYERLRDLLAQAYPLCVRAGASVPLIPGVAYLSIAQVAPTLDPDNVTCVWTMSGDTVAPPGASVIIPARTYDDSSAEASSYDGLAAIYPTYIDRQLGAA